jgi:hypothetical protein
MCLIGKGCKLEQRDQLSSNWCLSSYFSTWLAWLTDFLKNFLWCACLGLQFEQVVRDSNGQEKLPGLLDPALKDDYPLDAVWKVSTGHGLHIAL